MLTWEVLSWKIIISIGKDCPELNVIIIRSTYFTHMFTWQARTTLYSLASCPCPRLTNLSEYPGHHKTRHLASPILIHSQVIYKVRYRRNNFKSGSINRLPVSTSWSFPVHISKLVSYLRAEASLRDSVRSEFFLPASPVFFPRDLITSWPVSYSRASREISST